MKVTLEPFGLHFRVTLEPLWAYGRRMAGMMGVVVSLMVPLSAPIGLISSKYTFCRGFLLVPEGPDYARRTNDGAAPTVWEAVGGG